VNADSGRALRLVRAFETGDHLKQKEPQQGSCGPQDRLSSDGLALA
jgi:hypothetical protein